LRIAIISDIHGNAVAFEAVLKDMKLQSPDAVVFLGDLTMRGPQPAECVDMLRSIEPLAMVRGNYDHMFTRFPWSDDWKPNHFKDQLQWRAFEYDMSKLTGEQAAWIGHLPTEERLSIEGNHFELYHAAPDSLVKITYPWASVEDLESLRRHEDTDVILYGHIHHSYCRHANGRLVVNCGSVGLPFDGDNRASYAILDIEGPNIGTQLRKISYDTDLAIQTARANNMPDAKLFEYAVRHANYPYIEQLWRELYA